jgi:hypothetical protein
MGKVNQVQEIRAMTKPTGLPVREIKMNTKNRAWRFGIVTVAALMLITQVRAESQTVGALPQRGKLLVVDGALRALNANGTLRWKLS